MARKTPILLRRGGLSAEVMAVTRYTRSDDYIKVANDGKQSVQADFDSLMLKELVDGDGHPDPQIQSPNIIEILDGLADGYAIDEPGMPADARAQLRAFEQRLRAIVNRHNARQGHS